MPTTTSDDLSLINDTEFLEELAQADRSVGGAQSFETPRPLYDDAYAALESGLPMTAHVAEPEPLYADDQRGEAPFEPFDDPVVGAPPSAESRVPLVAAVVVIVACLTAGAGTAAYVFQDSLTRITAMARSTSR